MTRAVVNVATTDYYRRGQSRLKNEIMHRNTQLPDFRLWFAESPDWPTHAGKPYAFKAYAMKQAANEGAELLLWADASILPIRDMTPLWERIEREGYWFSKAGFNNYEWTADSAYPDLFNWAVGGEPEYNIDDCRAVNRKIPHVAATAFGLNVRHPKGQAFLDEYYRLASETRAFCGPWINGERAPDHLGGSDRCSPCGPEDVRGHRHDQTAASVIAWRLGFELTDPPNIFAYPPGNESTILLADGSYT